ncbi:MAG: hypothetical protein ACPG5U_11000 [Planktomarina sp.]
MTKTLGILLAISLTVNLAVAGAAVGFFLSDRGHIGADARGNGPGRGPGRGGGPRGAPPILGALLSGLERDERRALLQDLRQTHNSAERSPEVLNILRTKLATAVAADPMDRAAVAGTLMQVRQEMSVRGDVADAFIVDWLDSQSAEDRAKIAQSLLSRKGPNRR